MSLFKSVKYLDGDEEDAVEITRAGKVLVEFDNGDTFEGTYITSPDNSGLIRSGHGIYIWKTGGKYDGEYKNGRRNGHGIYVFGNGEKYDGEWLNNVKSGKGKYSYTNGDYFIGTWVGDKRSGKGVFYNAKLDNEVEGEWKDGRLIRDSVKKHPKAAAPAPESKEVKQLVSSPAKAAAAVEKAAEPIQEEPKKDEPIVKEEVKKEPAEAVKKEPAEEVKQEPAEEVKQVPTEEVKQEEQEPVKEETPENNLPEENVKEENNPEEDKVIKTLNTNEAAANDKTEETTDVVVPAPIPSTDAEEKHNKFDIPFVVVIFGAPASGKGTQCEFITKKFGLVHISTGDLLRKEIKKKSPLGLKAEAAMGNGELVSTELVNEILLNRLSQDDIKENGVLFDGYPRTVDQAEFLKSNGIEVDLFLKLDVPDEVLVKRATGRRTDPETDINYHIVYNPPPKDIKVIQRPDDQEEKVKERLKIYDKNLGAIQEFYTEKMKVVDGNRDRELVTEDVLGVVEEVHSKK